MDRFLSLKNLTLFIPATLDTLEALERTLSAPSRSSSIDPLLERRDSDDPGRLLDEPGRLLDVLGRRLRK